MRAKVPSESIRWLFFWILGGPSEQIGLPSDVQYDPKIEPLCYFGPLLGHMDALWRVWIP